MSGYLAFHDRFEDEAACIDALADLKWPDGFCCDQCQGRRAYHLASRPRLFECAGCGHQHSITAGTVFHKTRTPLRKWFIAAYLIAHDKRGVSALYLSRELAIRYETAWLLCHKIRHALSESSTEFLLDDYVEAGEAFYGSRKRPPHHGGGQTGGEAVMICAVQRVSTAARKNEGSNKPGCIAGSARIATLAKATAGNVGRFIRANIKAGTAIIGGGIRRVTASDEYSNDPTATGTDIGAGVTTPLVRRLFANLRAWLNGTHHGVSTKHLPRYLREWAYRFNRRGHIRRLDRFVLRRTVAHGTITYAELVAGKMAEGAA